MNQTLIQSPFSGQAGILTPGIPALAANMERYPVPALGSRSVAIHAGDQISVQNPQGQQPLAMAFFNPQGLSNASMLGAQGGGPSSMLAEHLAQGGASGQGVLKALKAAGFALENADVIHGFDLNTTPGEQLSYVAQVDGLLIVAAPGAPMQPDQQNPPTDLVLFVQRNSPLDPNEVAADIAPPLADSLIDQSIAPGSAFAYEVKAGQFIQVLDVKGRECSDFQAFSQRALDKGLEREIDPTTTRTMTGTPYPAPGIFNKYWTVDQEPLLELVQDTVGRHDSFNLACTARYYDDLGYPGHLNCSDNLNLVLPKYSIRPRGGWPAINFFFNTMVDAPHSAIGFDEPWSRAGDYVLLKALSDLVCVSTACPCDIDPANGWKPTPIQLRVYDKGYGFKSSIGFRKSTEAPVEATKESGFYPSFAKHTRDFSEYNGFWLANEMTNLGAVAEYWACREKAAVMDLSPLRKYEITGPDAEQLMQYCVTRNIKKLATGQIVYTAICHPHGGMMDDGTVFRLGETNFRWICGSDSSGLWIAEQAKKLGLNAWVRDSTDQMSNIAVQGPLSREILAEIMWTAPTQATIDELEWFRFSIARLDGFDGRPCIVSRTGYSGELGYEVFCHPKDAEAVFDRVWEVGQPKGMVPLGLNALDMLRIEAGLVFADYEFCDQTDPFEAGIGFTVPLKSKTDDFVGRQALERRKAAPQRKLVGLDVHSGVIPVNGDCLRVAKAQVGEITSAMKSPILGKVIALARVDVAYAEVGTEIEIGQLDGQQKRLSATVVPFPHYDPKKLRVRDVSA